MLNVIPCKNLRFSLLNQQLRIEIGLRLGSKKLVKNIDAFAEKK